MEIKLCSKADFDQIIENIVDFWGSERTLHLHHPIFLYEFGNSAFVIKNEEQVIAYLLGLLSQTSAIGYVHLVAVHQSHQGQGLGYQLYKHFFDFAKEQGCKSIKAITTVTNKRSIAFHKQLGMMLIGEPNAEGLPIVKDYGGLGNHRVVFQYYL